jgi:hypothetical protein
MAPTIAPRLNRVAAARTKTSSDPSGSEVVRERKPVDYTNTPGHKRQSLSSARPASLAAPSVQPRLNKVATARLNGEKAAPVGWASQTSDSFSESSSMRNESPVAVRKQVDYSSTPGHKRMSLPGGGIKSLQAPQLIPRGNRTSQARSSVGGIVPIRTISDVGSSTSEKENDGLSKRVLDYHVPSHNKRASGTFAIASLAQPSITPRINAAAMKRLSLGGVNTTGKVAQGRPSSVLDGASSKAASKPSARPSSSLAAHQDGAFPRTIRTGSAAPPSSFRF